MTLLRTSMTSLHALLLVTSALTLAACTTTTTQSFTVNENPDLEAAYVATDADFSQFDKLEVR